MIECWDISTSYFFGLSLHVIYAAIPEHNIKIINITPHPIQINKFMDGFGTACDTGGGGVSSSGTYTSVKLKLHISPVQQQNFVLFIALEGFLSDIHCDFSQSCFPDDSQQPEDIWMVNLLYQKFVLKIHYKNKTLQNTVTKQKRQKIRKGCLKT